MSDNPAALGLEEVPNQDPATLGLEEVHTPPAHELDALGLEEVAPMVPHGTTEAGRPGFGAIAAEVPRQFTRNVNNLFSGLFNSVAAASDMLGSDVNDLGSYAGGASQVADWFKRNGETMGKTPEGSIPAKIAAGIGDGLAIGAEMLVTRGRGAPTTLGSVGQMAGIFGAPSFGDTYMAAREAGRSHGDAAREAVESGLFMKFIGSLVNKVPGLSRLIGNAAKPGASVLSNILRDGVKSFAHTGLTLNLMNFGNTLIHEANANGLNGESVGRAWEQTVQEMLPTLATAAGFTLTGLPATSIHAAEFAQQRAAFEANAERSNVSAPEIAALKAAKTQQAWHDIAQTMVGRVQAGGGELAPRSAVRGPATPHPLDVARDTAAGDPAASSQADQIIADAADGKPPPSAAAPLEQPLSAPPLDQTNAQVATPTAGAENTSAVPKPPPVGQGAIGDALNAANPYMAMPIERVREDAAQKVKLAQAALAIREPAGTPAATPKAKKPAKPAAATPIEPVAPPVEQDAPTPAQPPKEATAGGKAGAGGGSGAVKEPWQMTKAEYAARRKAGKEELSEAFHFNGIVNAIDAGKPVPPEVRAEYPDLQKPPSAGAPAPKPAPTAVAKKQQLFVKADKLYPVASFADASAKFSKMRDTLGFGASKLAGLPIVDQDGKQVAHVTYNGNVFAGASKDWTNKTELLHGKKFEPSAPTSPPPPAETPPAALTVGARVRTTKDPHPLRITEVLPQSDAERENGEQSYRVKDEKTGAEKTVTRDDLKAIKETAEKPAAAAKPLTAEQQKAKDREQVRADEQRVRDLIAEGMKPGEARDKLAEEKRKALRGETTPAPKVEAAPDGVARDDTIKRIADESMRQDMARTIPVLRYEHMGTDGKWYGVGGTPRGVETTGQKRSYWVTMDKRAGTTHGKRFETEAEINAWREKNFQDKRQDFVNELAKMDDEHLASQEKFWLKGAAPKAETAPAAKQSSAINPKPQPLPRRAKRLPEVRSISDFDTNSDRVERRGDRTFVVDTKGARAPTEVVSDKIGDENRANLRKLTPAQLDRMEGEIRSTPYLSREGKQERLEEVAKIRTERQGESAPSPREPWRMTRDEFTKIATVSRDDSRNYISVKHPGSGPFVISSLETSKYTDADAIAKSHADVIQTAIREGKPVPAAVRAEYAEKTAVTEAPKGKNAIPEYQATLNPNGTVKWQHRESADLGGRMYDREYSSAVEMGNDIADKFGRRFANSVEAELKKSGKATNRAPAPAVKPAAQQDATAPVEAKTAGKSETVARMEAEEAAYKARTPKQTGAELQKEYEEQQKAKAPVKPATQPNGATVAEKKVVVKFAGGETVVSVPSKDKPGIAPKEQKKYLLAEVDKAIAASPHEYKGEIKPTDQAAYDDADADERALRPEPPAVVAQLARKYGVTPADENKITAVRIRHKIQEKVDASKPHVHFEVPGDGDFHILDSKEHLAEFRKTVKKDFPVNQPKDKGPDTVSAEQPKVSSVAKSRPATSDRETWDELLTPFASKDERRVQIAKPYFTGDGLGVATNGTIAAFALDVGKTKSKLEGTFPNHTAVVPGYKEGALPSKSDAQTDYHISDSEQFLRQLRQALQVVGDENAHPVRIYADKSGKLTMQAEADDIGSYDSGEGIAGREYVATLDGKFLTDAVDFMRATGNKDMTLRIADAFDPVVVLGKKEYVVQMPMRDAYSDAKEDARKTAADEKLAQENYEEFKDKIIRPRLEENGKAVDATRLEREAIRDLLGKYDSADEARAAMKGANQPGNYALKLIEQHPSWSPWKPAEAPAPDTGKGEGGKTAPAGVQDFGEKLGGARKDKVASADREIADDNLASMSFSDIWPKSEVDGIEEPNMAALAHALRSVVPTKPQKSYKVARWVESVKLVRSLMKYANENGFDATMKKMSDFRAREGMEGGVLEQFVNKIKLLGQVDRAQWDRIGDVRDYPDAIAYNKDGGKFSSPYAYANVDGRIVRATSLTDLPEAVKARLGNEVVSPAMKFEVRGRDGTYGINKAGDPLYRKLKTFATSKEALDYVKANHAELVQAWEAVKESDNVKETDVRRADNQPRTGEDYRKGKDATPQMFLDGFGFRGVEFGNWVSQGGNAKERQGMLNQAYDAMMDLSHILGVPTRALSLDGTLGLGLGSRGHGWASAHYEPATIVINLTKTRGAGALAHEWFHALDGYFQRQRPTFKIGNRDNMYITHAPETRYVDSQSGISLSVDRFNAVKNQGGLHHPENWSMVKGVRPEVEEAFTALVKALDASPMNKRSQLIDKGKSDGYWSRTLERAARSFENYIIAKMAERGYHNDYLANVVAVKEFARDIGRFPYLMESELAPVAKAFDDLFSTIKTRDTEKGTALYAKSDATADRANSRPLTRDDFAATMKRENVSRELARLNRVGEITAGDASDAPQWARDAEKHGEGLAARDDETRGRILESDTDKELIETLESGKKIKVFRAMQLIDGKLYPPMSAKVEGELREPSQIGKWERSDERPELAKDGSFLLDKGNKASISARYNPYFHTSRSPLNDQFSSAYKRPNMVTVEVEVPASELTSGYRAKNAKDAVGEMAWHSGPVSSKLPESKARSVILSRYAKPIRIVPESEVADRVAKLLEGENIDVPHNVVTPSLRAELAKRGVKVTDGEARFMRSPGGEIRAVTLGDKTHFFLDRYSNAADLAGDIREEAFHRVEGALKGATPIIGYRIYGGAWHGIEQEITRNYRDRENRPLQNGTPEFFHELAAKAYRDGLTDAPVWRRFLDAVVGNLKAAARRMGVSLKVSDAELRNHVNGVIRETMRREDAKAEAGAQAAQAQPEQGMAMAARGGAVGGRWYRGERPENANGDTFFSAKAYTSGDYGENRRIRDDERPTNPLRVTNKEELADLMGYEGDPRGEPINTPADRKFDILAKKYAQSKKHDSIVYADGSMGDAEMHVFSKEKQPGFARAPAPETPAERAAREHDERVNAKAGKGGKPPEPPRVATAAPAAGEPPRDPEQARRERAAQEAAELNAANPAAAQAAQAARPEPPHQFSAQRAEQGERATLAHDDTETPVIPPVDAAKPWRERLSDFARGARDMLSLDPTPNMTRAGVRTEQFEHASARFYAQRLVADLMAKVFPDSYGDRAATARYMDVLNKNNILGGYDRLVSDAEEARQNADDVENKTEVIDDLRGQIEELADLAADDPVAKKDVAEMKKRIRYLESADLDAEIKKAEKAEQLHADVAEAHDLDAYEAEMQAARQDPEMVAAAAAWNQHVVPHMDQLYNEMKGMDPNTESDGRGRYSDLGERVNLLPMNRAAELAEWGNQDKPLPEITTSNYRNPNVRRDPFARKAKLTGTYATDAELILLNSLGGRINEVTKLRLFKALERQGAGAITDGRERGPASLNGEVTARLAIRMPEPGKDGRTALVEKSLYVPRSIAPEVRSILNTDMKLAHHPVASFVTQIQLMQLADMASHLKNMHSVIVNALGRGSVTRDLLNRVPFLSSVNSIREIWKVGNEVAADTPAIRAEIAEMAKWGGIRPSYPSTGIQKITHGQQIIHAADTAARIIMNRRYSELVARGWAKNDQRSRRDFVQQLGEYNRRLMGRYQQAARDIGISPFIVAGRTYNRYGRRLVTGAPGFEATSKGAEWKARAIQLSTLAAAAVIPALFNTFTTGSIFGRPATPIGAIDLGPQNDTEDGKQRIIDLFHLIGIRRGLRSLGVNAVMRGVKEGQGANEIAGNAIEDAVTTAAHPWVGPGVGFVVKALTGVRLDLRRNSYSEPAKIGDDKAEGAAKYLGNAANALKEQNPFLYGVLAYPFQDTHAEALKDVQQGLFKSPLRATGYSEVKPSAGGQSSGGRMNAPRMAPPPRRERTYGLRPVRRDY